MSEPKKSSATPEGTGAPLAAAAMRNAAEAALRERKAQSAPSLNAPSAEASQEMLHELQVHQIELEMQNEELQRKQLALDAANRRYFELYDLAPVGYCTLNEVGLIVQANLSASTMLGIERGALVKQPFSRFIFSDDMDSYYRLNKALQKGQIAPVVELRVLRKDAAPGWVQLMGNAYQDADGAAGLRLVLSDIGERKRQEQLRAETENKLQEILNQAPALVYALDLAGRFTLVNQRLASLFGQPANAILGRTREAFLPKEVADLHRANDLQIEKTGEAITFEEANDEPNGQRTYLSSKFPLRDLQGAVVAVCGISTDITEHVQAQKKLLESETRFRGLVEQSLTGIYVSQDNIYQYVNPRMEQMLGYGSGAMLGMQVEDIVVEEDLPIVIAAREKLRAGALSCSYEVHARRKDGTVIEIGVQGSYFELKGKPATVGMAQDITEKRHAEEEVKRYNKELKSAFMGTVEVATTLCELRDPYTAGHQLRVGMLAQAIGAELGFDAQHIEGLRVAGYLHDIGKMTVPAEILSRPGKLRPFEYALIQGHPQAGYEVLKKVKFPWPLAEITLQHHERMDGSGYPQGLKGEAILLDARIMAVADVVESMASHRPYRSALGIDAALAEIEGGSGSKYDAAVAQACLRLFREKGYALVVWSE